MVKGVKGATAKMYAAQGYINQMNHYIQHGDWCCDYYGEYEEKEDYMEDDSSTRGVVIKGPWKKVVDTKD